jgi:CRISPR-associated endonuclease/helicase Cas3
MPTMATADGVFPRVVKAFSGKKTLGNLLHGRASLDSFYGEVTNSENEDDSVTASDWLSGRHLAILAPVTVATCDQVLAAAVNHKHSMLRHSALSNKHVILDEVHTYDPYQDFLLTRNLEWLGYYGARVTLLTATLPAVRRNAYLKAYCDGARGKDSLGQEWEPEDHYPAFYWVNPAEGEKPEIKSHPVKSWRNYEHFVEVENLNGDKAEFVTETAQIIGKYSEEHPEARIGVIVNTVDRAIALNSAVKKAQEKMGRETLLLHSRMQYKDRKARTDKLLKELGSNGSGRAITVISTQIAEASLDVDFDILITDICPTPSLLQRMGRQWRHSLINKEGHWVHNAATLNVRTSLKVPLVTVLVPTYGRDVHPAGHFPYTRAEVEKTRTMLNSLPNGNKVLIPGDLQSLVDLTNISLSSLKFDQESQAMTKDEKDYLSKVLHRKDLAKNVGVGLHDLVKAWGRCEEKIWSNVTRDCVELAAMTTGKLFVGENHTRLTDSLSVTILPYCALGEESESAWDKNPYALTAKEWGDKDQQKEALSNTISVSGATARALDDLLTPERKEKWFEIAPTVLRYCFPMSVADINECGLTLDRNGLRKTNHMP